MEKLHKKPLGENLEPAPGNVSLHNPSGMILSTGNIYFTTNDESGAHVYRMGQTDNPGQERELYHEPLGSLFGDITFAEVGGAFFGYFFAKNGGDITIKRISLDGSQVATVLTPPINDMDILITHHNLVTDGNFLYWQQSTTVKKMSVNGGEIITLDPCEPNTPTAGVYLQGKDLIYASVNDVRYVPTIGSIESPQFRTIATANARVLSIAPAFNGTYWSDNNGAIQFKHGSSISTIKDNSNALVTSMGTNPTGNDAGVLLVWVECDGVSCALEMDAFTFDLTQPIAINPLDVSLNQAGNVAFWGDDLGVHRLPF